MTRMVHAAGAALLAGVLLSGSPGVASAQSDRVYVLESTASTVKVGTAFAAADRITIPAGATIRVVMPSGKTQTIKGPYSGSASDLTQGQESHSSVMSWLQNLLQTGGSTERTPGATRSARPPPQPAAVFSWTAVPVGMDNTICVRKGVLLELWRTSSSEAEHVAVIDDAKGQRGEVEFKAGSQTAAWPSTVIPQTNATYSLLTNDGSRRRKVTLRVLDAVPSEDDTLAELAKQQCKYQFEAWVKGKLAAAKTNAQ